LPEEPLENLLRPASAGEALVTTAEADLRAGQHDLEPCEQVVALLATTCLGEQRAGERLRFGIPVLIGVERREHDRRTGAISRGCPELGELGEGALRDRLGLGEAAACAQDPRAELAAQDGALAAIVGVITLLPQCLDRGELARGVVEPSRFDEVFGVDRAELQRRGVIDAAIGGELLDRGIEQLEPLVELADVVRDPREPRLIDRDVELPAACAIAAST